MELTYAASLETRRATLTSLLRKSAGGLRLCEHIEGTNGITIFGHACRMGLEGWPSAGIGLIDPGDRLIG
jgi:hypothetical protein